MSSELQETPNPKTLMLNPEPEICNPNISESLNSNPKLCTQRSMPNAPHCYRYKDGGIREWHLEGMFGFQGVGIHLCNIEASIITCTILGAPDYSYSIIV